MKNEQTIAQFLKVKDFPFEIKNKNGNRIYSENSDGYWLKCEYDDRGNQIRHESTNGYWFKHEYDEQGNIIRHENSSGYWSKWERDDKGNEIRYEDSNGEIIDKRSKPMIELTLEDIAKMKGVDVCQIRIKE
jgi:YD repeat-containing protein